MGADNYAQVAFNYDADSATVADNDDSSEKPGDESEETPDEIYVPHPKFIIPVGMVLVSAHLLFFYLIFVEILYYLVFVILFVSARNDQIACYYRKNCQVYCWPRAANGDFNQSEAIQQSAV